MERTPFTHRDQLALCAAGIVAEPTRERFTFEMGKNEEMWSFHPALSVSSGNSVLSRLKRTDAVSDTVLLARGTVTIDVEGSSLLDIRA